MAACDLMALQVDTDPGQSPVCVSYPAAGTGGGTCQAIIERGNVPLMIGDSVLAELSRARLDAEWAASGAISDNDAADYCRRAAARLSRAFDSGLGAADVSDMVANAAVLFVLTLRNAGVMSSRDIAPCRVVHDGSRGTGEVRAAV